MRKPNLGQRLRVTTDWTDLFAKSPSYVARAYVVEGEVVASDPEDPPNTFRLLTSWKHHPISVISYDRVRECIVLSADAPHAIGVSEAKIPEGTRTFLVEGSTGNQYVVTYTGKTFTCTCPAGQMSRSCKHVKQVRAEHNI